MQRALDIKPGAIVGERAETRMRQATSLEKEKEKERAKEKARGKARGKAGGPALRMGHLAMIRTFAPLRTWSSEKFARERRKIVMMTINAR